MATTTVRIGESAYRTLQQMARREGKSMQDLIEQALKRFEEERFWDEFDRSYKALRLDSAAWNAELQERQLWETTLRDGIEPSDDAE